MEPFLLPANVLPAVIPSGSGNEDGAAPLCLSVCGEKRPGVLGKDVDSVTVQLLSCPALIEAVGGGSAGCGRLRPVSAQPLTRQHPLPLEEVVWMVGREMRYYPRPGDHREALCFLPGSADGFHRNEAPKPG